MKIIDRAELAQAQVSGGQAKGSSSYSSASNTVNITIKSSNNDHDGGVIPSQH
ncbi:hypothetical protein AWB70_03779 [Caballeronia cordobensis]|uniref:Uncharacterized protein n=1 Tax=Caballeronia cordobensis TaxID=1353886 RepID=A0A158HUE7_CABCO|nr:hypothetical protein [Caballeronia cordobensis]SAL47589.1 hypothetical protein AWB70_03779 [Caballeronia cordobensis]